MSRTIVVVTFNSSQTLRRTLSGIRGERVVVVDNGSSDSSPEIALQFENVELIRSRENRGYSYGVNRGVERAAEGDIVILNPDIMCSSADIDALAGTAALPGVGVVGPRLVYPGGLSQGNGRRFPTFLELMRRRAGKVPTSAERGGRQPVDWLMGALLYVPRHTLELVGPLNERYRLYCEDVDYCARVWKAGLAVILDADITTEHVYQRASHGLWRLTNAPVRWHWASMLRLALAYPTYFTGLRQPKSMIGSPS